MASLFDTGIFSIEGINGAVLPGAKLYWYAAGSSLEQATYSDADLTIANPNPVVADASGRFPEIYLQNLPYKYILTDAHDVVLVTRDNYPGSPNAFVVTAGIMSFDTNGNYVADGGGLHIGGPTGVWLRQEGFAADGEEGSLAQYPLVANRPSLLSIAPSGEPWNMPGEVVSSVATQMRNGASEERLTIAAHWFGGSGGSGEYRIGTFKNGSGHFWPLSISNNDARQIVVYADGTVSLTNETFNSASAGNTVFTVTNPGVTGAFRLFARPSDSHVGIERTTSGVADYEFHFEQTRVRTTAPQIRIDNAQPALWIKESDGAANGKNWILNASGGTFYGTIGSDDEVTFATWLAVHRSGSSVTGVQIGGAENLAPLNTSGSDVIIGYQGLTTTATSGLLFIPSCAGAPTGTITPPYSGAIGLVYDRTNNKLYANNGGSWKASGTFT